MDRNSFHIRHDCNNIHKSSSTTLVARFEGSHRIATDQDRQCELTLCYQLLKPLSFQTICLSPYYAQGNRIIERIHRKLEVTLMCKDTIC